MPRNYESCAREPCDGASRNRFEYGDMPGGRLWRYRVEGPQVLEAVRTSDELYFDSVSRVLDWSADDLRMTVSQPITASAEE